MPTIDTYRKRAKQLVRWHRDRNYSIGEKFRLLERYRHLTDIEALNTPLSLTVAQEIVAVEAGFTDWAALRISATTAKRTSKRIEGAPKFLSALPILFVRDVKRPQPFTQKGSASKWTFSMGIHLSMAPCRAITHAFICGSCTTSPTLQHWPHVKSHSFLRP